MYAKLLSMLLHMPEPYEKTDSPFWDDRYLGEGFLKAHLDPVRDAASRNHGFISRSADWIAGLVSGNALLDLGCGPGLYAQRLARTGLSVTGIDISPRALRYARQMAEQEQLPIQYIQQDYTTIQYDGAFDTAILIFCDYGVLPPKTRMDLLSRVRAALKPGGRFIVDVWSKAHGAGIDGSFSVIVHEEGGFFSPHSHAVFKRHLRCEGGVWLDRYIVLERRTMRDYNVWNRAFDEETLSAEMMAAGFGQIEWFADATGEPYSPDSPTICAVATV